MKPGLIVTSLKGHDTKRSYLVVADLGDDFVLVADGKYRTLEKPKLKRRKHLKAEREVIVPEALTDKQVRELCRS